MGDMLVISNIKNDTDKLSKLVKLFGRDRACFLMGNIVGDLLSGEDHFCYDEAKKLLRPGERVDKVLMETSLPKEDRESLKRYWELIQPNGRFEQLVNVRFDRLKRTLNDFEWYFIPDNRHLAAKEESLQFKILDFEGKKVKGIGILSDVSGVNYDIRPENIPVELTDYMMTMPELAENLRDGEFDILLANKLNDDLKLHVERKKNKAIVVPGSKDCFALGENVVLSEDNTAVGIYRINGNELKIERYTIDGAMLFEQRLDFANIAPEGILRFVVPEIPEEPEAPKIVVPAAPAPEQPTEQVQPVGQVPDQAGVESALDNLFAEKSKTAPFDDKAPEQKPAAKLEEPAAVELPQLPEGAFMLTSIDDAINIRQGDVIINWVSQTRREVLDVYADGQTRMLKVKTTTSEGSEREEPAPAGIFGEKLGRNGVYQYCLISNPAAHEEANELNEKHNIEANVREEAYTLNAKFDFEAKQKAAAVQPIAEPAPDLVIAAPPVEITKEALPEVKPAEPIAEPSVPVVITTEPVEVTTEALPQVESLEEKVTAPTDGPKTEFVSEEELAEALVNAEKAPTPLREYKRKGVGVDQGPRVREWYSYIVAASIGIVAGFGIVHYMTRDRVQQNGPNVVIQQTNNQITQRPTTPQQPYHPTPVAPVPPVNPVEPLPVAPVAPVLPVEPVAVAEKEPADKLIHPTKIATAEDVLASLDIPKEVKEKMPEGRIENAVDKAVYLANLRDSPKETVYQSTFSEIKLIAQSKELSPGDRVYIERLAEEIKRGFKQQPGWEPIAYKKVSAYLLNEKKVAKENIDSEIDNLLQDARVEFVKGGRPEFQVTIFDGDKKVFVKNMNITPSPYFGGNIEERLSQAIKKVYE